MLWPMGVWSPSVPPDNDDDMHLNIIPPPAWHARPHVKQHYLPFLGHPSHLCWLWLYISPAHLETKNDAERFWHISSQALEHCFDTTTTQWRIMTTVFRRSSCKVWCHRSWGNCLQTCQHTAWTTCNLSYIALEGQLAVPKFSWADVEHGAEGGGAGVRGSWTQRELKAAGPMQLQMQPSCCLEAVTEVPLGRVFIPIIPTWLLLWWAGRDAAPQSLPQWIDLSSLDGIRKRNTDTNPQHTSFLEQALGFPGDMSKHKPLGSNSPHWPDVRWPLCPAVSAASC